MKLTRTIVRTETFRTGKTYNKDVYGTIRGDDVEWNIMGWRRMPNYSSIESLQTLFDALKEMGLVK